MSEEIIKFTPWEPDWTERVLAMMSDSEKVNGKPKNHGLRRMVELIIGRIYYSDTEQTTAPNKDNEFTSVCKYVCKIKGHDGGDYHFSDVADATYNNVGSTKTDKDRFAYFVTTVSSTRAKSRAWRDALGLAVVTFDELPKDVDAIDAVDFEVMNDAQVETCRTICKRLKIKFEDFVFEETGLKDLAKISRLEGARLVKELNKRQQTEN